MFELKAGGIASTRLGQGFSAKPQITIEGSVNYTIPGKPRTDWEGGFYPLSMEFNEDYPNRAPVCKFPRGFFHPNIHPSGKVCSSILYRDWRPDITVKKNLLGIQNLLHNPNPDDAAQHPAKDIFQDPELYRRRVREQAIEYQAFV